MLVADAECSLSLSLLFPFFRVCWLKWYFFFIFPSLALSETRERFGDRWWQIDFYALPEIRPPDEEKEREKVNEKMWNSSIVFLFFLCFTMWCLRGMINNRDRDREIYFQIFISKYNYFSRVLSRKIIIQLLLCPISIEVVILTLHFIYNHT